MKTYILIILLLIILIGLSCREEPTEPPPPSINLTLEENGVTEVWLSVKFLNEVAQPRSLMIERDGDTIINITDVPLDTTIIDNDLFPMHTYSYKAFGLINSVPLDSSTPLILTTMDTTSHDFTWQIDTLGGTQSSVNGLWGSDENNIYAVGRFTSSDTTAHLAHWDGYNWMLLKPCAISCFGGIQSGNLQGIYGVSSNEIWAVGFADGSNPWGPDTNWGFVVEWNGTEWKNISPDARYLYFSAVWASSANDVFVVGSRGSFYHYNGTSWYKIETGTDYNFYDVWGFSNSDIYMVGYPPDQSAGIVLHYNGESVQRINVLSPTDIVSFTSLWGTSERFLYVASDGGLFTNRKGEWTNEAYPGIQAVLTSVRGNNKNNIFSVGHVGKLLHYNGYNFKSYEQTFVGSEYWILHSVKTFSDKVFIGGSGGEGFERRGIILRGRK